MTPRNRAVVRPLLAALILGAALCQAALPARGAGGGGTVIGSSPPPSSGSGGASIFGGGLAPVSATPTRIPAPPSKHAKGRWLKGVAVTEYWPAPESWFVGQMVKAPGLTGLHRIDWLYSAAGLSMQGSGIGLDGRIYHIDTLGDGGWITATGASTSPGNGWSAGTPYWRAGGYWRNAKRGVTFPLSAGGWANGRGSKYVPLRDVTFAAGSSLPLHYYQSIAVDPSVIPLGSRVYVPAYRTDGYGGWFVAQDTGGAINGRHIDVYRSPPASPLAAGQSLAAQRVFVIKPKQ
jgi:3D (Asp-Asp-Asp) domain-containing protein